MIFMGMYEVHFPSSAYHYRLRHPTRQVCHPQGDGNFNPNSNEPQPSPFMWKLRRRRTVNPRSWQKGVQGIFQLGLACFPCPSDGHVHLLFITSSSGRLLWVFLLPATHLPRRSCQPSRSCPFGIERGRSTSKFSQELFLLPGRSSPSSPCTSNSRSSSNSTSRNNSSSSNNNNPRRHTHHNGGVCLRARDSPWAWSSPVPAHARAHADDIFGGPPGRVGLALADFLNRGNIRWISRLACTSSSTNTNTITSRTSISITPTITNSALMEDPGCLPATASGPGPTPSAALSPTSCPAASAPPPAFLQAPSGDSPFPPMDDICGSRGKPGARVPDLLRTDVLGMCGM